MGRGLWHGTMEQKLEGYCSSSFNVGGALAPAAPACRAAGRTRRMRSALTERVSPAGGHAHHAVGDVVARDTDRLDTARVLNVLGQSEQRDVVVLRAAVVALVRDDLHDVNDPLRAFLFKPVVFAQHHAEVRGYVRWLSAL